MFLAGNSQIPNNWWKFARHQLGTPVTTNIGSFYLRFYIDQSYSNNYEFPVSATIQRLSEYLSVVAYQDFGPVAFQHEYIPLTQPINAFLYHEALFDPPNTMHTEYLRLKFDKEVAGAFEFNFYGRRDQYPPSYKSGTRFYIRDAAPYKCTFKTYPTALTLVGSYKLYNTTDLELSSYYSFSRAIWSGNNVTIYYYEKGNAIEKSVYVECSSKPPTGEDHFVIRVVNGELLFQVWSGSKNGEGTLVARPNEHPHFAIGAGNLFYVPVLWGLS